VVCEVSSSKFASSQWASFMEQIQHMTQQLPYFLSFVLMSHPKIHERVVVTIWEGQ
jgi:hypothetical protein